MERQLKEHWCQEKLDFCRGTKPEGQVWLVYEDDYGGLFSPYILTKVCESEQEAWDYAKGKLASVVQSGYAGTLDISAYPRYHGGRYSDD